MYIDGADGYLSRIFLLDCEKYTNLLTKFCYKLFLQKCYFAPMRSTRCVIIFLKEMSSAFVARGFLYFCCGIGAAADIYDVVLL